MNKNESPTINGDTFSVAFGSGRRDSNLKCKPATWGDILAMITVDGGAGKIQIIPKKFEEFCALPKVQKDRLKNVPWWIIGVKGTHRNKKNITARTAVMLDVDHLDNEGMAGVWSRLDWNGLRYAAYTSVSHAPERNAPRWRIILPTSEPILSAKEYAAVYLYLTDLLGAGRGMDTACQDWSRLMYLPSCCEDRADVYESRTGEGKAVDMESVREVIEYTKEAKKTEPTEISADSDYFTHVNNLDGRELCRRFASHVWQEERGGRWTYIPGEGVGGGVWFTDKKVQIFYSHHASDPWQGKGQNVWQFVSHYLFNGDTRGGKVQRFFRENYGIEYVAEDWEKKDLKDERLKKQDNIAFLKEVSRAGSPYHYFIRTIPIPEEKEYDRDSLYNKIWNTLDRIRNIFIPQREREYNRDCWQLVQLVSNWATNGRSDSLAGATETIIDRIITSRWRPEWMRRRYDALNKDTDPRGLEEARSRCREIWSWFDEGRNIEIMEYWIRQVKYDLQKKGRRIIPVFWTADQHVGKTKTACMISAILEGCETFEEFEKKEEEECIISDGELNDEIKVTSRFERPRSIRRRSCVLDDIKANHLKYHYDRFMGIVNRNTTEIESKGIQGKEVVRNYPNYIITTNNEANEFLASKKKERRMYAICWDNAIRKQVEEPELWEIIRSWVMAIEERDWSTAYYESLSSAALSFAVDIDIEGKIKESEAWIRLQSSPFNIKDWIERYYPFPSDDYNTRAAHRKKVVEAFRSIAPDCMKPQGNTGYYQWVKRDILLESFAFMDFNENS